MTFCSGPFTVETVGENPFLCGYKVWLTSKPEKVWEFANGREMGEFFQQLCSASRTT
jgi:hypothetical protein